MKTLFDTITGLQPGAFLKLSSGLIIKRDLRSDNLVVIKDRNILLSFPFCMEACSVVVEEMEDE